MLYRMIELERGGSESGWPYDYCIYFIHITMTERKEVADFLESNNIKCWFSQTLSTLYLCERDAIWFALRWTSELPP